MQIVLSIDSLKPPLTGIGRYTLELALAMREQSNISITYLAGRKLLNDLPSGNDDAAVLQKRNLIDLAKLAIAKSDIASRAAGFASSARQGLALRSMKLRNAVYHGPNFYLPRFVSMPAVVTFHDISVYSYPQYHPPERIRYMHGQMAWSLKRANLILTDSESVRNEIAHYFSYPLERIRAIPLAASAEFQPRSEEACGALLEQYGLSYKSYCLYSGTVEPRKNIDALLDAYAKLPISMRLSVPLVICGYAGWKSESTHARIKEYTSQGWVRNLGYVPDTALPTIMSGARLFVFPSHYEGFGLPVLEAMASGVPVLCSEIEVLQEVAGNAATYIEPKDVDDFTEKLARCIGDEGWRESTKALGLSRCQRYSWEQTAKLTIEAYQHAAST